MVGVKSLFGGIADRLSNKAPVSYSTGRDQGIFGWTGGRHEVRYMAAMGNVGTLFSIVNRTSTATSAVNWHLYRKPRNGGDAAGERVEVFNHQALNVWNTPNEFYTRQEFVESTQQHVDLTGESWWCVAYFPGTKLPMELWPMRPDRVTVIESKTNFIQGYVYMSPTGDRVPLDLNQVISLRMPNPLDPYRGMGPVQSILTDLDSTRYSAEWNRNFFANNAEPGGIIQVEKRMSNDEWREMRERWNEQHKGVANAHRVAILEQGQWIDRKYTNRDMQFAELRQVSRDTIREAFGVTKFDVGDIDDVNRATAEASETRWGRHVICPRLERYKRALNANFLPLFGSTGQGVEFDYDSPIPPDDENDRDWLTARTTAVTELVQAGFDATEACEVVGLPVMKYTRPVVAVAPKPDPQQDSPDDGGNGDDEA